MRRRQGRLVIALGVTLLTLAFVAVYWFVGPSPLRAKTLAAREAATAGDHRAPAHVAPARLTPPAPGHPDTGAAEAPAAPAPSASGPPAPASPPRLAWPRPVVGRVLDAERRPLARAAVVLNGVEHFTNAEGAFSIDAEPSDAPLLVKAPGFEKRRVEPTRDPLEVALRPHAVKAAYLTYFGVSDRTIRGRVLDLVARTELNAVVIDIKGDRGWIPYRTEVPLALAAGAQGAVILKDIEGMLAEYRARGIYTIARVVAFKDNVLAHHRPDLAIIDTRTGKPWVDNEKLAWVDPFRQEVWEYNIAIAREAVRKGFDEVQFDYVRFPTDGRLSAARYSRPNNKDTRLPTIAAFLERARREIGPTGAFVAADIFGYTAFNENDTDIGQRIEELAPHLDYMCPMVYPSGYHLGIPGTRNPVTNPYRVVYESVRLTRKRAASANVRIRPWLQDFKDYAFDRRVFGIAEVRAQMRGAEEAGGIGWMLWNPKNDYTGAALTTKGALASR